MWDQLISLLSFHKINIKVLARLGSSEESREESTPKLIQFIGIMLFWQLWEWDPHFMAGCQLEVTGLSPHVAHSVFKASNDTLNSNLSDFLFCHQPNSQRNLSGFKGSCD